MLTVQHFSLRFPYLFSPYYLDRITQRRLMCTVIFVLREHAVNSDVRPLIKLRIIEPLPS